MLFKLLIHPNCSPRTDLGTNILL
uniref:Uncharacterized protein n=1 Tax=Arundo donax TaxID=35708 RepID=A0A0A9GNP3_ARUDO